MEIDQLFAELNNEKKWIYRWPSDPVEEHKIEPENKHILNSLFSFADKTRISRPEPILLQPNMSQNESVADLKNPPKISTQFPDESEEWMEKDPQEESENSKYFTLFKSTHHPLVRMDISDVSANVEQ